MIYSLNKVIKLDKFKRQLLYVVIDSVFINACDVSSKVVNPQNPHKT